MKTIRRASTLFCLASAFACSFAYAQASPPPHLAGEIEVDPTTGRIAAGLCLSRLAARSDSIYFVLHRGLNVKRIRGGDGGSRSFAVSTEPGPSAVRYGVSADTAARGSLCVEYTGALPVYDVAAGDYRDTDGSNVIAFNGRTLRARGESLWYPAPHDPSTGQSAGAVTFNLRVRCDSCEQIYLNGAAPQPGPEAVFASDVPREPVIIAGSFPVQEFGGMRIMGDVVTSDTARMFAEHIAGIRDFYEEFVGVPYGSGIDFMRVIPVRVDRPFGLWGFFSDPLLGIAGVSIGMIVAVLGDTDHPARAPLLGFISHELAHRYFAGPLRGTHSALFSEPFANYVALKATRHYYGSAVYDDALRELHANVVKRPPHPPLDEAGPGDLAKDSYRYHYAPLMLVSLEQAIGERAMRQLLRSLLTAPAAQQSNANYAFLRATALRSGVDEEVWRKWEDDCMRPPLESNACLQSLVAR